MCGGRDWIDCSIDTQKRIFSASLALVGPSHLGSRGAKERQEELSSCAGLAGRRRLSRARPPAQTRDQA